MLANILVVLDKRLFIWIKNPTKLEAPWASNLAKEKTHYTNFDNL